MQKLDPQVDGASPDITLENIQRLREIFPEAFADGKIDIDVLRAALGDHVEDQQERYSFTWNGKSRTRRIAQMPSTGTLRPCLDKSVDWDTTQNICIEGDNLEVLKLLQKSYHRKVGMIYIDPPYNTGNEFIYPDRFQDNLDTYLRYTGQTDAEGFKVSANAETGGRYHTNWLNMMYPRLKLARSLLAEDGVICASIDDHESFHLRHLLDEIFGSENHLATIAVSLNPKGRQLAPFFATAHEYILIYARNIDLCVLEAATADTVNPKDFPINDDTGQYRLLPLRNTNKKFNPDTRPNLHYPMYISPESGEVSCKDSEGAIKVTPVFGSGAPAVWRWGRPKAERQAAELFGRKVSGRLGERWDIFQRDYLTEGRKKKLTSVWLSQDVGSTDAASKELKSLNVSLFDTPKPTKLIKRLVSLMPADSLVMDFFAGSGTTGDAVMQLNEGATGENRRFILVQLPEPVGDSPEVTVSDVTQRRLKEASSTLSEANKFNRDGLGFRYFRLDSSNIKPWDADFDMLEESLLSAVDNIKADRSEDDVLYELLLKYGLDLAATVEQRTIAGQRVFIIGSGALVVCLGVGVTLEAVEGIARLKIELKPEVMRVVFRDASFKDDVAKTNTMQILKQGGIDDVKSL